MSNSSLINYTNISPNKSAPRNKPITKITIHHVVGVWSAKQIADHFKSPSLNASCNYGIGNDGQISLVVDEKDRSWCSSNAANDHQAITIEVANSALTSDYPVSDKAYDKLIDLCVDICKRNNISKLYYDGTPNASLTHHWMFSDTTCPGPYLKRRTPEICAAVNSRLEGSTSYSVRVTADTLNIRTGPGTNHGTNGSIADKGVYTIIQESSGQGSTKGWGKLKSGAGWISLEYVTKL
ncbi:MAG: N-acetylmuramoyl-L-alanine amidase [Proteobacteria bacterium]|nr:N-acetylmuramoyl-L-alanine amidase [Cystobacterineae bacterium]MCL2314859.1 N-acetylmuramoyl-L-alanine amidase [Pseudomonadota bacterium]